MTESRIVNNEKLSRFETELNGEFAYLEYRLYSDSIIILHTFAPPSMRGKGISSSLAKHVLDYAKTNNLKIMVYCPFVTSYLKAHPEYESQLDVTYCV